MLGKINKLISFLDLEVSRPSSKEFRWLDIENLERKAKENNISVADYYEKINNQEGNSKKIIDTIFNSIPEPKKTDQILEIGPGTGRFLAKTLKYILPEHYQIFELDKKLAEYLVNEYTVVDNRTYEQPSKFNLDKIKDNSIDYLFAHGVFNSAVDFYGFIHYFSDMSRVLKNGGFMAFNIISEDCLKREQFESWKNSDSTYIKFISNSFINQLNAQFDLQEINNFIAPYGPAVSKYVILQKK